MCHSIAYWPQEGCGVSQIVETPREGRAAAAEALRLATPCIRYVMLRAQWIHSLRFVPTHKNHRLIIFFPSSDEPSRYRLKRAVMASVTTKRRSGRQAATRKRSKYVDPESDDDFMLDDEAEYLPDSAAPAPAPAQPATKKRKASHQAHRPQTRSKAAKTKSGTQTRIIGKARKPRTTVADNVEAGKFKGPSDGKIPD